MNFVKRKEDTSNKKEYCYLKDVNDIDRKTLKKIGYKYKDEQIIDDIECEIWIRKI